MADASSDDTLTAVAAIQRELPPGWRPFMREADLTRTALATGLNALAKANHMQGGFYNQAFFNISIGLERLLKLIFLIEHGLTHAGAFPSEEELRNRFRHDLKRLFEEAIAIRHRLQDKGQKFQWELVDEDLAARIVNVLAEFARATRYYNLDYLVGARRIGRDPLEAWAQDVASYLVKQYPATRRVRDEKWAAEAEQLLKGHVILLQETETGQPIRTVRESALHGRMGDWIQQKATFHTATVVRYLTEILTVLNYQAGPGAVLELPHLWEYFTVFGNPDSLLKYRKTFLI
jgi:hypothetical protein